MFLRKSCFSLPGQQHRASTKRPVRKSCSLPYRPTNKELGKKTSLQEPVAIGISESGNTVVAGGTPGMAARARGFSPRPKLSTSQFDSSDT
jgi:hypothetical protein